MARIGIDLDGVCYDFAASLRQYLHMTRPMGSAFMADASKCVTCMSLYPDPQRWEFYRNWGMTTDLFQHEVRKGVDAGVVFLWGPAHEGTKEALEALNDAGHRLICVTDRLGLGGEQARTHTHEWVKREGLPFSAIYFDADKTAYDCDYFVDDKLENYDALDRAGVKVYLWDRPWNQDDSKERRRVSSWDEFLEQIEGVEYLREGPGGPISEAEAAYVNGDEVRITSSTGGQKGTKPARFGLIPKGALWKVAELYGRGAEKYDDWNWRKGYNWSLSMDALERHYALWSEGEELDSETGQPHLASVVFHALALLTFTDEHPEFDDRFKRESA